MSELPPPSTPLSEFFSPIMLENDDDYDTGVPVQNPPKPKKLKVPKTEAVERLREQRFSAILLNVKELQKNLNKTLLHPDKYPRLELPSDLDSTIPIETDYLERIFHHHSKQGLIPSYFRQLLSERESPSDNKFYLEIMGSVAYSLHQPAIRSTGPDRLQDLRNSLERYMDIHIANRGSLESLPYSSFCIVEANMKDEIPVHYGQTAHLRAVEPRLTPAERDMNVLYRQALIYVGTHLTENQPTEFHLTETSQTTRRPTQCAEVIAWPFIMQFARDFLRKGQKTKRIEIVSLTLSKSEGRPAIPFCTNCSMRAKGRCNEIFGLRIVDASRALGPDIYQSEETLSKWSELED
ncbi:hypothetical protein JR316_0001441 [Psilocybe cubensis]|uniref:Uncharacterized protein n=2 Tax=Psilocybe cubensis TaxID=181762 RepID=A0ACB8HHP1_PSICU|nr:hypothetical protein JR316_0001441 [Psilocybe cubensis]KAH9487366.1 hypothetical protein JR316_0001441 [Psilocybe cubensis]